MTFSLFSVILFCFSGANVCRFRVIDCNKSVKIQIWADLFDIYQIMNHI